MTLDVRTDKRSRITWWLTYLHEALAAITFVPAVLHLLLLRKFNPGVLVLFLLPPTVAAVSWKTGRLSSTRVLGAGFLLLLLIGDAIAPFHGVLSRMNCFPELPLTGNRVLSWYGAVYLLYAIVILPPPLFIRPLIQRKCGEEPYFSWPTCCLGLLCWLIMAPPTAFISVCLLLGTGPFKQ